MNERPNLFDFATSELSQDAFLLWLASFAAPECLASDPELHRLGQSFVRSLLETVGQPVDAIRSITVRKQVKHIDVAVIVNGTVGLIIEDKTVTKDHDDQFGRYLLPSVGEELGLQPEQLHGIYLKTGNECERREWGRWHSYTRANFIEAIGYGAHIRSDIARDFIERLNRLERDTQAFRSDQFLSSNEATFNNWLGIQGFYQWLVHRVDLLGATWWDWDYVSNASGGFLGFWAGVKWVVPGLPHCGVYLQMHHGDLACARVSRPDGGLITVDELRHTLHVLQQAAVPGLSWRKPARFRGGASAYAALATFDDSNHLAVYSEDGQFDEASTQERLKRVWQSLSSVPSSNGPVVHMS